MNYVPWMDDGFVFDGLAVGFVCDVIWDDVVCDEDDVDDSEGEAGTEAAAAVVTFFLIGCCVVDVVGSTLGRSTQSFCVVIVGSSIKKMNNNY